MSLDHEAIYEAYKSEQNQSSVLMMMFFDVDGNSVTLDQSKIDA